MISLIKPMKRNIKMGEKSILPIGGIIFLTGAIMGSVTCTINCKIGCGFILPENIITKDITIDPISA
jgi:hypothetical protein|tara:strand:+ start:183 stop:383 length:201 start_codon:yes stop_codon:yes gene_type:complete